MLGAPSLPPHNQHPFLPPKAIYMSKRFFLGGDEKSDLVLYSLHGERESRTKPSNRGGKRGGKTFFPVLRWGKEGVHTVLWENDSECLRLLGVADTIKTCSSSNQNDNPLCPAHPSPLPSPLLPCGNRSERPFPPIKIPLSIPPLGERDSGESLSTIRDIPLGESPYFTATTCRIPFMLSPRGPSPDRPFAFGIRERSAVCRDP